MKDEFLTVRDLSLIYNVPQKEIHREIRLGKMRAALFNGKRMVKRSDFALWWISSLNVVDPNDIRIADLPEKRKEIAGMLFIAMLSKLWALPDWVAGAVLNQLVESFTKPEGDGKGDYDAARTKFEASFKDISKATNNPLT